jgi:hypothetical protein
MKQKLIGNPIIQLISSDSKSQIILDIQEIEYDRAQGIGLHTWITTPNIEAVFYNVWVESSELRSFLTELNAYFENHQTYAHLKASDWELYITLNRNNTSDAVGFKAKSIIGGELKDYPNAVSINMLISRNHLIELSHQIKKL